MPRSVNYITEADLIAKLPAEDRNAALDDDRDGIPDSDVITSVIEQACDEVDTFYSLRGISVPVDPKVYPLAKQASLYLATETCYTRRQEPAERNPHCKIVASMRRLLEKLGDGTLSKGGAVSPNAGGDSANAVPGDIVDVESEPSLTYGGRGKILT